MTTAAELRAQLEAEPNWAKERARRDAYWTEVEARYKQDEKELVAELNRAGVFVKSVSEPIPHKELYPTAIPILFSHLKRPYLDNTRAMIARALAVPYSAPFHDELVKEMRLQIAKDDTVGKGPKSIRNVVQGLAIAVAASTTEDNISSLISLVKDESLGDDRLLFLRRLKKSKQPSAVATLRELASDPTFSKEISSWKRKSRNKS